MPQTQSFGRVTPVNIPAENVGAMPRLRSTLAPRNGFAGTMPGALSSAPRAGSIGRLGNPSPRGGANCIGPLPDVAGWLGLGHSLIAIAGARAAGIGWAPYDSASSSSRPLEHSSNSATRRKSAKQTGSSRSSGSHE